MKRNITIISLFLFISAVSAQTNEFTYQGSLNDGALPANANYDFEFRLFAGSAGGTALETRGRPNISVANGLFSVRLDFAAASFDGSDRYLEIAVKLAGSPAGYQVLLPRQQIASSPYSIRSLNAANATTATNALQLGGIGAGQYVVSSDPRMTDARLPVAGSGDYVQNRATQQASTNFNISGNGTVGGTLSANVVNGSTQYNLNGSRIISVSGENSNLFVGINSGSSNTTGVANAFLGWNAGENNISGVSNSFFGYHAGRANTTGSSNSFFGSLAGANNSLGTRNSFFGRFAGNGNVVDSDNSFFGYNAGVLNQGSSNSFFGSLAGSSAVSGSFNSFFGHRAGEENTGGQNNSFFGRAAGAANTNGWDNVFVGAQSGASNTVASRNTFLGSSAGEANMTGADNVFAGYNAGTANTASNNSFFGSQAGDSNTTGDENSFFGRSAGHTNTTGSANTYIGYFAGAVSTGFNNTFIGHLAGNANTTGANNTVIGQNADVGAPNLIYATAIGAGSVVSTNATIVLGRSGGNDGVRVPGTLNVGSLLGSGNTDLCINASDYLSTCSSSLRYKSDVAGFNRGLSIVQRLRPIVFDWKDGGKRDVGFAAEEVNEIEPLLATYNKDGQIEGVKYGQITTVLVNAIKEQQKQIEELKQIVCELKPAAAVCKRRN